METEIDINGFEKQVVKTFCEEYLTDAFHFLSIRDKSLEIQSVDNIPGLVNLLLDCNRMFALYLHEDYITQSFLGFEKCIERQILKLHPDIRGKYKIDSHFTKNKNWLYEIFYRAHSLLIQEHPSAVEFNNLTGVYDDYEIDPDDIVAKIQHNDFIEKCLSEEQYKQKLDDVYNSLTGVDANSNNPRNKEKKQIDAETLERMSQYFNIKGIKNTDIAFKNKSHLVICGQEISFKKLYEIVSRITEEHNEKAPVDKAYAAFWIRHLESHPNKTKEDVAKDYNVDKNSLTDEVKTRVLRRIFNILFN